MFGYLNNIYKFLNGSKHKPRIQVVYRLVKRSQKPWINPLFRLPSTIAFAMGERIVWQYRNSTDDKWKDMPKEYSDKHEVKYLRGEWNFEYDVHYGKDGEKTYHYVIDLNAMTQTNMKTRTVRRLRRHIRSAENDEFSNSD